MSKNIYLINALHEFFRSKSVSPDQFFDIIFEGSPEAIYFHAGNPAGEWSFSGKIGLYSQEYLAILIREGKITWV